VIYEVFCCEVFWDDFFGEDWRSNAGGFSVIEPEQCAVLIEEFGEFCECVGEGIYEWVEVWVESDGCEVESVARNIS
jgi:hypothetical protein